MHQPAIFSEMAQFFSKNGIDSLKLRSGQMFGWRSRAKLAMRTVKGRPSIGLFKERSHQLIDIPFCRTHHPVINQTAALLRDWILENQIPLYDEQTGMGSLRYVQITIEKATGSAQVALVLNHNEKEQECLKIFESLWEKKIIPWHSLWLNFNQRRDNVIFGSGWLLFKGEKWLKENFLNQKVYFHPASFIQANIEMFTCMMKDIQKHLPLNADLVEFYAGVGCLGLVLAKNCKRVRCVEMNPLAKECFEKSLSSMPQYLSERLAFTNSLAAESIHFLDQIDPKTGIIIVDPPRKGLEEKLLKAVCQKTRLRKIIYISCGWKGFQKDCQELLASGWRLEHAEAYLFFPGTEQLEILAVFEKGEL